MKETIVRIMILLGVLLLITHLTGCSSMGRCGKIGAVDICSFNDLAYFGEKK